MAPDWYNLAEAFVAGGFPWISQFRQLEIHFKLGDETDLRTVFNFFGSLFATSIYGYSIYAHPIEVVSMPAWWVFILTALVLTVFYLGLFLLFGRAKRTTFSIFIVITSFVIYVGIFCSLTAGYGALRVFEGYYILRGQVVDSKTRTGVPDAEIDFSGDSGYGAVVRADKEGKFVHLIEKKDLDGINEVLVTKKGYRNDPLSLPHGFSLPPLIKRIEIEKEVMRSCQD